MKFLLEDLYFLTTDPNLDQFDDLWNVQVTKYLQAFKALYPRLPKRFVQNYLKTHFHDFVILSCCIKRVLRGSSFRYDLIMDLQEYANENVHQLHFQNVSMLKSNLCFQVFCGTCDWIFAEFLPVDDQKMSLEVVLFSDSKLYFEFTKLKYKKYTENKS